MYLKAFRRMHPLVILSYFLAVFVTVIGSKHPWMTGIQAVSLIGMYFYHERKFQKIVPFLLLAILVSVTNPLLVQRGATILWQNGEIRMTKEALFYGIWYGCLLMNVCFAFSLFQRYFQREHWVYLSGTLFPKLGVMFSMALALVPRYQKQAEKMTEVRKKLKKESPLRRAVHVFSMETTWAFEMSVDQLDSMNARGYGVGKRTHFHLFSWDKADLMHMAEIWLLFLLNCYSRSSFYSRFFFYPMIIWNSLTLRDVVWMLCMAAQILLPFCWKERYVCLK